MRTVPVGASSDVAMPGCPISAAIPVWTARRRTRSMARTTKRKNTPTSADVPSAEPEAHPDLASGRWRHRRAVEEQRPADEREERGYGDRSGPGVELDDEEPDREEDQEDARPADRKIAERNERQDERQRAKDAGDEPPGRVELGDDAEEPEEKEQVRDVRIADHMQDALGREHRALVDDAVRSCGAFARRPTWRRCVRRAAEGGPERSARRDR